MRGILRQILCVALGCCVLFYGQLQGHPVKRAEKRTQFEVKAQGNIYQDTGCNISSGWNLTGRDWGCCGNYEGCCKMASVFCYFHDKMCQCCRLGWLICGPECKPDIECMSDAQDVNTSLSDLNSLFSSPFPLSPHPVRSSISINSKDDPNSTEGTLANNSKAYVDGNSASQEQNISFTESEVQTQPKDVAKPNREPYTKAQSKSKEISSSKIHVSKTFSHSNYFEKENTGTTKGILNSDLEFFSLDANTKHQNIHEGSGDME